MKFLSNICNGVIKNIIFFLHSGHELISVGFYAMCYNSFIKTELVNIDV